MTHYHTLELAATASAADIRRAYRRLVLVTHPDRTPDPAAHARYLAVNTAYEVLSDPGQRAAYDHSLSASTSASASAQPAGPASRKPFYRAQNGDSYLATYLKYAPAGRAFCKAVILFSLLLGVDRAWVLDFPNELVRESYFIHNKGYAYCIVETSNTSFRGQCLNIGEKVSVRQSAILRQVVAVCVPETSPRAAPECYDDTSALYTSGVAILPIAMLLTAIVGAWPGPARRRQVDCAMTAAIFAIIVMWLLVSS